MTINDGHPFVNQLQVFLKLKAIGATDMMLNDDLNFTNSVWNPFDTLFVFEFADSSYGPKPVFAKFKDAGGIESNIVHNQIMYEPNLSANLQISTNIQDAGVYIGNKLLNGSTPFTLENIPFGEYVFSVSKSGYTAWPTIYPISIESNQLYSISFTLINTAPQPVKYFAGNALGDTLNLEWIAPSDADLEFTQINYRTDGIFPSEPNDGIILISQLSLPDELYNANIPGLEQGVTYYLSAFAIDSAGNHSDAKTKEVIINPSTTFQLSVSILEGWNMVSIPGLHPTDQNVTTWWIDKNPAANVFKFDGSYQSVTEATPGEGYWMLHSGNRIYNTGDEWPAGGIQIVPNNPISGNSGWNLIGGYEITAATSGITTNPSGLQQGSVFGYTPSGGYATAADLVPGYAYWILLSGPGMINIPTSLAKGPAAVTELVKEEWGRLVITDNAGKRYILYGVSGEVNLNNYLLPPAPPAGMFDVRYGSGRYAEDVTASEQMIEMSGIEYPITVRVENMAIRVQDETGKIVNTNLKSGETITITDVQINKFIVSGELLPDKFELMQNYPNPFNPSTTIKFAVLKEINVNLSVYNILGERVAELKNEMMKPGYHQVEFDASAFASGVYIYRIIAGDFVKTRKMMVIK